MQLFRLDFFLFELSTSSEKICSFKKSCIPASPTRSLSLFSFSPLSSTWPTPTPPMTTTTTEATTAAGGRMKGRSSTSKSGLTSRKTTAACRPTDGRCRQHRRQSRVKNDFISGAGWRMVLKGFSSQALGRQLCLEILRSWVHWGLRWEVFYLGIVLVLA